MTYLQNILDKDQLKNVYRNLAIKHHPDRGGNVNAMQQINHEYSVWKEGFASKPIKLTQVKVGHTVFVNKSPSIVTQVEEDMFKAVSLNTRREAYFDKRTGYGVFNLRIKAML